MTIEDTSHLVLLAIVMAAVIIDWRTTKIPNLLTFPAAAIGIGFNFMRFGWNGALHAVAAWVIGAAVIVGLAVAPIGPKYSKEKIGMGDAKLIAAIGAFLCIKSVWLVIFYFCLFYGLLSLIVMARTIPWKQVSEAMQVSMIAGKETAHPIDTTKLAVTRKSSMPISIAILAATIVTIAFGQQTLLFLGIH